MESEDQQIKASLKAEDVEILEIGVQSHINSNLNVDKNQTDKLEKEEQRYWKEYSKYKRELLMAEDDFRSLDCQVNEIKQSCDAWKTHC